MILEIASILLLRWFLQNFNVRFKKVFQKNTMSVVYCDLVKYCCFQNTKALLLSQSTLYIFEIKTIKPISN